MDLVKLHEWYGGKISFMGGIDVRALCSNDRAQIDAELEKKIPCVKQGFNTRAYLKTQSDCTISTKCR